MKRADITRLVNFLLLICGAYLVFDVATHPYKFQLDFDVYYYAAQAHAAGLNPYGNARFPQQEFGPINHKFVYPPLVLYIFRLFALLDYQTAFRVYLALKLILLAGLIFLWRNKFLEDKRDPLFYLFCFFAFNATIYLDIATGNVSIIEQILIWSAFYFLLKRKYGLFCLLLILAAQFKMVPILFVFLLLFLEGRKKYLYIVGALIAFGATLALNDLIAPSLFPAFARNAVSLDEASLGEKGRVNPSTLVLVREILMDLTQQSGRRMPAATIYLSYLAVVALIVWFTRRFYRAHKPYDSPEKQKILIYFICLTYALILPRFKDYSFILLLMPFYFIMKKKSRFYVPLFILIAVFPLPSGPNYPGLGRISFYLGEYYSLLLAYVAWFLYASEVSRSERISFSTP